MSSGSYPSEVSWAVDCSDGSSLSGGAPYLGSHEVSGGASCTLDMQDRFGDGWNGAEWEGFGKTLTLACSETCDCSSRKCLSGSKSFVLPHDPPSDAPAAGWRPDRCVR